MFESGALESFRDEGNLFATVAQQSLGLVIGLVGLTIVNFIPPRWYLKFPYFFYLLAIVLMILCFIPGKEGSIFYTKDINGARRWIFVCGQSIQVAELVKVCVIIFFAYLGSKTHELKTFLVYLAPLAGLFLLQKDLGSLIVVAAVVFGMYFLAGADWKSIGYLVGGGLLALLLMILLSPYRRERLLTFLHPERDLQGDGYHVSQMLIAIGRGGLAGKGIGNSRQKFFYVPEASSDSIFSIVAEEVGFVGVVVIFLLYVFFLVLIWQIGQDHRLTVAERLMARGLFIVFLTQTFINLAAIAGLLPLTGITLPFFSAGGSSLIVSLSLVGLALALTRDEPSKITRRRRY